MGGTCMVDECDRDVLARRMCGMHYNRARLAGKLDEIAPDPSHKCDQCGGSMAGRLWGSRFCSKDCKQAHADQQSRERTLARHMARVTECAWCKERLGVGKRDHAKFCSKFCNDSWQNHQRAIVQKRATLTTREPCPACGEKVPESRPRGALYCSARCKSTAQSSTSPKARQIQKRNNLQYSYGLTTEGFAEMLAAQEGRCAICGTDTPGGRGAFHVDHCHTKGNIRGLLCHHCNVGLGNFKDIPDRLRKAADYLERTSMRE